MGPSWTENLKEKLFWILCAGALVGLVAGVLHYGRKGDSPPPGTVVEEGVSSRKGTFLLGLLRRPQASHLTEVRTSEEIRVASKYDEPPGSASAQSDAPPEERPAAGEPEPPIWERRSSPEAVKSHGRDFPAEVEKPKGVAAFLGRLLGLESAPARKASPAPSRPPPAESPGPSQSSLTFVKGTGHMRESAPGGLVSPPRTYSKPSASKPGDSTAMVLAQAATPTSEGPSGLTAGALTAKPSASSPTQGAGGTQSINREICRVVAVEKPSPNPTSCARYTCKDGRTCEAPKGGVHCNVEKNQQILCGQAPADTVRGTISADPNPCSITSDKWCLSVVRWNVTQDNPGWEEAQVRVSVDGGPEEPVGCSLSGSVRAKIAFKSVHVFNLYPASQCGEGARLGKRLAGVTVQAEFNVCPPLPAAAPPEGCRYDCHAGQWVLRCPVCGNGVCEEGESNPCLRTACKQDCLMMSIPCNAP